MAQGAVPLLQDQRPILAVGPETAALQHRLQIVSLGSARSPPASPPPRSARRAAPAASAPRTPRTRPPTRTPECRPPGSTSSCRCPRRHPRGPDRTPAGVARRRPWRASGSASPPSAYRPTRGSRTTTGALARRSAWRASHRRRWERCRFPAWGTPRSGHASIPGTLPQARRRDKRLSRRQAAGAASGMSRAVGWQSARFATSAAEIMQDLRPLGREMLASMLAVLHEPSNRSSRMST